MPERRYEKYIDDENEIYVYFKTEKGIVVSFTVQLKCRIEGNWYEVVRYDSGHDVPHKDIILPDGSVGRKIWYRYLNNNQALDFAIDEITEQYEFLRWRFEQWLKHIHQQ